MPENPHAQEAALAAEATETQLDLGALGQAMLDALAIMQAPDYVPEPIHVTDELLAQMLAFLPPDPTT